MHVLNKIPSLEVANVLNDWYVAIRKLQVDKSIEFAEKAKAMTDEMEEDQELLIYYSLLEHRHKILLYDLRGTIIPDRDKHVSDSFHNAKTSELTDYYFFLFEAMYEASNSNYDVAIGLYREAEQKLSAIPDDIERAEFYFKMAWLYYRLDQHVLSLRYIRDALAIYKEKPDYNKKQALSLFLLAGNCTETGHYEKAESYYNEAENMIKLINDPFLEAQLHHNKGILYSHWGKSALSITHLEKALTHSDYYKSEYYYNSSFMLIKELCIIGDRSRAQTILTEGRKRAFDNTSKVFIAKTDILSILYLEKHHDNSLLRITEKLDLLENCNHTDSVKELSRLAAKVYEDKGFYQHAVALLNKSIEAEQKLKKLEWM
ncbi:Rap family tetratricopeptide repeat protein [Bacillus atrophaeus]|uniref:Rap family tetratricopeptide repeat protein n=1 Tax=Bacillus atrophaeus TaxID=1452 RepID=UPI0022805278|nr:Rap family tetratricopeptide repeat protein [Bacillus atrophaeus]MCY8989695.1 tetratricopeptide repeat protein [Bacillus atrophaeus]